ncbi:hypothetical protein GGR58DRAFT_146458 [Xylaria digitata]|nr:hypothetical protein GGR58DRAFT_146458 [Xylaria digitata]
MNSRESITSWIQGLPEYTKSPTGLKKRKLLHQEQQLGSPSASLKIGDENNMVSTPKRRRLEGSGSGSEPDVTSCAFVGDIPSLSDTNSMTSEESGISGTSAPTEKIALLRLVGKMGITAFNIYHFPKAAGSDSLLESIEEIGRGLNILPYRMKSTIEQKVADLGGSAKPWSTTFQPPEQVDHLPGRIPNFEEVDDVVKWGERYQKDECEKAAWNCDVHLALLRKIFGDAKQKINAMLCDSSTTARPSKYFKLASSTDQLIDICIYNSIEQDECLMNKTSRFCANLQTNNSINHTDYNPLRTRPLLLSIKTEKPETSNNKAQLQIGVWYSTQWSFLRWAVGQKLKRAKLDANRTTTEIEADTLASLSQLGFIPGIVVHGHRWCLVLSTYDGKKTTLWEEHQFGTTSSILGAFCAIAGIRRLTAWANDHYWPWFEKNVLD